MPIEIPAATKDKLNRLRLLGALAHRERADQKELEEWGRLTGELAGEFLPVVQLLVQSGLLTLCAEDEKHATEEYLSPEHRLVAWEADHVFLNGDIWLKGGEVTTTMPKPTRAESTERKEVSPFQHQQRKESEMTSYEKGFVYVAEAYANHTIPEDEGKWEVVGPPDCEHSIEEILDHFARSDAAMPNRVCKLFNLPEGSSYEYGVDRISNDKARRSPDAPTFHAPPLPLSTPKGDGSRGERLSGSE